MDPVFRRTIPAGSQIFAEGDAGTTAFIIEGGAVEIFSTRDGEHLFLAELGEGEIFGEMALIDDNTRSASARATRETQVVVIDRDQIITRLEDTEPVIVLLIKILLHRFRTTQHDLLRRQGAVSRDDIARAARELTGQHFGAFEDLKREQDLKRAIEAGELVPYFMPIYKLGPVRRLAGFESLVRWIHPERGFVSPAEFVPVAEQSGLIRRVDETIMYRAWQVLGDVEERLAERGKLPAPALFLSVNLSGRHFVDADIVRTVESFLADTGCPPERLKLELTESVLIKDPEQALDILQQLKALGVVIALDDFGTGYSSLSYLHRFPLDTVKIDQVFVRGIETDPYNRKIINTINQLAQALNLDIIAEGIETPEAEAYIRDLGCDYGQGFFYAKPVPGDELLALIGSGLVAGEGGAG